MTITATSRQRKVRELDEARGISHALTDPAPARQHVQRLVDAGFPVVTIAATVNRRSNTVWWLLRGDGERIRGTIARRWLALTPATIFAHAPDNAWVPTFAAARRIRALVVQGYPLKTINDIALAAGHRNPHAHMVLQVPRISAARHRAIAAIYDQVGLEFGPSETSRARALKKGWHSALAWDEDTIDDPWAGPCVGEDNATLIDQAVIDRVLAGHPCGTTPAEREVLVPLLAAQGRTDAEAAALMGISDRTVLRARQRLAIDSRWAA